MGKRSDFARNERDFYPTPETAVLPLLAHLKPGTRYIEPCAGDGALIDILDKYNHHCLRAYDIEPLSPLVGMGDATVGKWYGGIDCYITNPPWDRKVLHPIIRNLAAHRPCWLLFDADWMHTKQATESLPWLVKVVSVGRVKWIPDSKMTGKDNCCWYLFDANNTEPAQFYGRT